MSKICCIKDVELSPKASSCSMTLRSACAHHKNSPESSTSICSRFVTPLGSKHCPELSIEDSFIHSLSTGHNQRSILEEPTKDTCCSMLKDYLNETYRLDGNVNLKVVESNVTVSSTKLHNINGSAPVSSGFDFLCRPEDYTKYSRSAGNNMISNRVTNSTSSMSRTSIRRSTISSVRTLSGSEGEDDIRIERITRARNRTPDSNSNYVAAQKTVLSEESYNGHQLLNSQAIFANKNCSLTSHSRCTSSSECDHQSSKADLSELERLRLQGTIVDKMKWVLWRSAYLKMIGYVNFDVWCLSRLHSYGKSRVALYMVLFLLLPFVLGFLCQDFTSKEISQTSNSLISPVFMLFSSLASVFQSPFVLKDKDLSQPLEDIPAYDSTTNQPSYSDSPKILSLFSSRILYLFSGWFAENIKNVETNEDELVSNSNDDSLYFVMEDSKVEPPQQEEKISQVSPSADELRVTMSEMLRKEKELLIQLQKAEQEKENTKWVEKERILLNEIKNLKAKVQTLSETVEELKTLSVNQELKNQNIDAVLSVTRDNRKGIDDLNFRLDAYDAKIKMIDKMESCCDKQLSKSDILALLNTNLIAAFKNVVDGHSNPSSKYYFFSQWLNDKFLAQEKLMPEISAALKKHSAGHQMDHEHLIHVVESTVYKYVDSIKENFTKAFGHSSHDFGQDFFNEDRVRKIIKDAIMLYDADKTGQVDYALESGGASVVGTRCTETYHERYGKISLFGIPLWTYSNSPRTAIQPDMQPGRCWGFKGSEGYLVLALSATISPTGFTMEHIPLSLSPSGSIDSAPKRFSVWGLEHEKDSKGILLGDYVYDIEGEPLQYFKVQNPPEKSYSFIELKIHSNHGNMEYTCLYRFRVHGHP